MPPRKNEEIKKITENDPFVADNLIEQLLNLKHTFTQVLNSVCHAIEKDCGEVGNEEKANELARIKQKYSNIREEVCRIISEFTMASPVSKEETVAVQEGLTQCMNYLNRVHNSMESILQKYEETDNDKKRCCDKVVPHLHKNMDGNHVIIQLKKGTQSELEYVSKLMNNVNCMPEDKRKKVFNKMCHLPKSSEELGAGDDIKWHYNDAEPELEINQPCNKVPVKQFQGNKLQTLYKNSMRNGFDTSEQPKEPQVTGATIPQRQEMCQNWFFPEKIIDSLLAGYSWTNRPKELVHNKNINPGRFEKKNDGITDNLFEIPNLPRQIKPVSGSKGFQHSDSEGEGTIGPFVYDSKGNPLTDSRGQPMKNIHGHLLVKYQNNKPIGTLDDEPIFDQNCLPFVITLDAPLLNINGDPIRLFNRDGIPLTDDNGYPLKLVNGKFSIHLDQFNRLISDACGLPLFDCNGNQITNQINGKVYKQPKSAQLNSVNERTKLYNDQGFSLTNTEGKPLNDMHGNPLIIKDKTSGCFTDTAGNPVFDAEGNIYGGNTIVHKKLALYDCNKYPLTNSSGGILHDVDGNEMILCDTEGRPFKDLMNRGFPLIDVDGSSLNTSEGKALIVCDEKGNFLHDINGYPIFDKFGIPLTQINGCWTTPHGLPYRVFDSNGFPLTNERGESLLDLNGHRTLKLDQLGRPVLTSISEPVCDVNGAPATHSDFDPSQSPPTKGVSRKIFMHNRPMKVFNQNGMPLTDLAGIAMLNAKGKDLIQFDDNGIPIKDEGGGRIFDEYRIPLNCQPQEAIISTYGKPFRIYDKLGRPLTDAEGIPLNLANGLCMITFDNAGRPITDFRNDDLYDYHGRTLQDAHSNADECIPEKDPIRLVNNDRQPVRLYNKEGMPLTNRTGTILNNADGTQLRLNDDKRPVSDWNGDPIYNELGQPWINVPLSVVGKEIDIQTDPFGRVLKDACGEAQFDKYGRPLYDLYRRRLYDNDGVPIANAYGRNMHTNLPEPKEIDLGFNPIILTSRARAGQESLTDLIGGPLFDYLGIPLYNQYGKPLIDIYGRPLYDDDGMPLCDKSGKPVSELVRKNGKPTEVIDVYKPIEVNKEVAELIDNTVIRSTRTEHSPNIPGIWILPSSTDNSNKANNSCNVSEKKMYWALLRITTFDDGKKSFEILEAKPYEAI